MSYAAQSPHRCDISLLCSEILHNICASLDHRAVSSLRLCSTLFGEIGREHLTSTLCIYNRRSSLKKLKRLCDKEISASWIKTLRIDPTRMNVYQKSAWLELQEDSATEELTWANYKETRDYQKEKRMEKELANIWQRASHYLPKLRDVIVGSTEGSAAACQHAFSDLRCTISRSDGNHTNLNDLFDTILAARLPLLESLMITSPGLDASMSSQACSDRQFPDVKAFRAMLKRPDSQIIPSNAEAAQLTASPPNGLELYMPNLNDLELACSVSEDWSLRVPTCVLDRYWHVLRSCKFTGLTFDADGLDRFLVKHAATLEKLSFRQCRINERSWASIFSRLRGRTYNLQMLSLGDSLQAGEQTEFICDSFAQSDQPHQDGRSTSLPATVESLIPSGARWKSSGCYCHYSTYTPKPLEAPDMMLQYLV